jgi:hypothetical protein
MRGIFSKLVIGAFSLSNTAVTTSLATPGETGANAALAVLVDHAIIAGDHAANSIGRARPTISALTRIAALRCAHTVLAVAADAFIMRIACSPRREGAKELDDRACQTLGIRLGGLPQRNLAKTRDHIACRTCRANACTRARARFARFRQGIA